VTAVVVPENWNWNDLKNEFKKIGIYVSGSYGVLENKVFRIGHMGLQADLNYLKIAFDKMESIFK
jgi:aspartate aminotransferase-like enzyme